MLKSIPTFDPKDESSYVLGQYTKSSDGKKPGYTEDESVENKESKTATYAEMVLKIDNERWQGVPWILKSAKAIEEDIMRVIIHLKPEPNFQPLHEGTKPAALVFELFETKRCISPSIRGNRALSAGPRGARSSWIGTRTR